MKHTHWYLRSWEYEDRCRPDGTRDRVLVYKGEYYRIGAGKRSLHGLKAAYAILAALLWAVLAVLLTHFSRGASLFFVGGACGLTLIPAIYLAIGCISAVGAPSLMTYRDMRASYHRIRSASKWILGLMAVCLAGEVFYLTYRTVNGHPIDWRAEGLWLAGGCLGVSIPAINLALLHRYRVELCPPGVRPKTE